MTGPAAVFHPGGALGDFVLTFPLLRTLARAGETMVITAAAKASLAARVLEGVTGSADHLPPWPSLWRGASAELQPRGEFILVIGIGPRPPIWIEGARAVFPNAEVHVEDRDFDRDAALVLASRFGTVPERTRSHNHTGPALLHTGAGGAAKAWPLERWLTLAAALRSRGRAVSLIAGEVEYDRWPDTQHHAFADAGGTLITELEGLERMIRSACVFIGADSGPGHLAAQLGVPTLSLFGPTDPARWRPVGPAVEVVRSLSTEMERLDVPEVLAGLARLEEGTIA